MSAAQRLDLAPEPTAQQLQQMRVLRAVWIAYTAKPAATYADVAAMTGLGVDVVRAATIGLMRTGVISAQSAETRRRSVPVPLGGL
jgi:glutamate synthase domain-containing protein 2